MFIQKKVSDIYHKVGSVFVGSLLLSIGINGFLVPYQLLDGGVIGIALVIHYYFHISVGLGMIILSIPICLYACLFEKDYFYSSLLGLVISALFINWLAPLNNEFHLPILASALLAGVFIGIGTGIMLRFQASTGGTDLIARIISKAAALDIGIVIFLIDGLIVTIGFSILGVTTFIFSCITIITVGIISSVIVGPAVRF